MAAADHTSLIAARVGTVCDRTNLLVGTKYTGKVRDVYETADHAVLVTTDRLSAFDRLLAVVPFKGAVLNGTSAYWFETTRHIIPNAVVAVPHPNVTVARKCTPFRIEFVVRGYLTGTTSTSIWVHYAAGARAYCGHALPDGMRKNQALPAVICTPTTKDDLHDRPISGDEIVAEGWMTAADWAYTEAKALELFAHGQAVAASRGLILVDTKYEFGKDASGTITLIDEVHTPDSSRYWLADTYAARFAEGKEPENIDKEFLRKWYREQCDPYADAVLPAAPRDLVVELSRRYITLYEKITGKAFDFDASTAGAAAAAAAGESSSSSSSSVADAIAAAVAPLFPPAKARVVVLTGRDEPSVAAAKAVQAAVVAHNASASGTSSSTTASSGSSSGGGSAVLARTAVAFEQYFVDVASGPLELVALLRAVAAERIPTVLVVAAAGGVDHVSRVAAAQTKYPVILVAGSTAAATAAAVAGSSAALPAHTAAALVDAAGAAVTVTVDAGSAAAAAIRTLALVA